MSSGIFLQAFRTKFVEEFISDVANTETSYFVAFGRNQAWPDDNNPPVANSNIALSSYEVDREMLFGKQVFEKDIAYMIPNKTWTSNTIYDYYDDQDPNLFNKDFYVINSSNRVYKCLFNNYNSPSTVEPNDTNPNVDFNTYPDGYKWKYMFRVSRADYNKFATLDYIPVKSDPLVQQYAESGAVHVIVVDNAGNNYPYAIGSVNKRISPFLIQLANNGADAISGIYQDSSFYVESGSGNNFITNIVDYTVNTSGKFITTSDITPLLDATTQYRIGPQVVIDGDGTGLKAFAYIEPTAQSVYNVQIVSRGVNYSYANVAFVANTIALGTGGQARAHAIISPIGGHGSDAPSELGCQIAGLSVETSLTDDLPEWVTYRQVSLIYNPKSSFDNTIYLNETFRQYTTLVTTANKVKFTVGGRIKGFTSGATAEVIYSDQNHIYVKNVLGTFTPYETVRDLTTGLTTIAAAINTGDLVPFTGKTFYYRNIEPVSRADNSKEQVKLYFNF